jgi:flagellar assembly factor FliW
MQIQSSRFGSIEAPDEAVIHFPRGLFGLENVRHYCLLQHDDQERFHWLHAVDDPGIAMLVVNPLVHFPTYEFEIPDPAAELLRAATAADVAVYASITVAPDRQTISANLLGPLVINHEARIGLQLVLDGNRYSTRHVIGVC